MPVEVNSSGVRVDAHKLGKSFRVASDGHLFIDSAADAHGDAECIAVYAPSHWKSAEVTE